MSNVLPHEFQKQQRVRTYLRIALLCVLILTVTALGALVALTPAYLYEPPEIAPLPSAPLGDSKAVTAELKRAQLVLNSIAPTAVQKMTITNALEAIIQVRPSGVRITSLTYGSASTGKNTKGTITVSGTTNSRNDIAAFRVALVKTGLFESVSLPVGVLVDSNATSFDVTVTGAF